MKVDKKKLIGFFGGLLTDLEVDHSIALKKYRKDVARELKAQAKKIDDGDDDFKTYAAVSKPIDQTLEYQQLIRLLQKAEKRKVFLTIDSQVIPLDFT